MLRYAITDGKHFNGGFHARKHALLENARRWAGAGVDYVQLREKTMNTGDLLTLTVSIVSMLRELGSHTKLLVNGRADVALAGGADGVHLTAKSDELTPAQARQLFREAGAASPLIGMSCHMIADVVRARKLGADFIVFGPVFEKRVEGEIVVEGSGLHLLREACRQAQNTPVLALGGVNDTNTPLCIEAGAEGVAGIRLFS